MYAALFTIEATIFHRGYHCSENSLKLSEHYAFNTYLQRDRSIIEKKPDYGLYSVFQFLSTDIAYHLSACVKSPIARFARKARRAASGLFLSCHDFFA